MRYIQKTILIGCLAFAFVSAGCNLLDVENPNNLVEDDLSNPASAIAMANGAEAVVTNAVSHILTLQCTATDELTWSGSRDSWQQLDFGIISDPFNEFTDGAFPDIGEARWVVDNFINRLEEFRDTGALTNPELLGRVYLYKAIVYIYIADSFDDFAFSNRTEPAPNIGRNAMSSMYDDAIAALGSVLSLNVSDDLKTTATAVRARAYYSKDVWSKITPVDTANPLVNNASAVADAQAVLAAVSGDWVYELVTDGGIQLASDIGGWVNDRREMRIGSLYGAPTDAGNAITDVIFEDMIDGIVHPYLDTYITDWIADTIYPDIPVVSEREMHLILAEAALAAGNDGEFTTQINAIRDLDGLTQYSGQVDAQDLLIESRQVNLFLQGRRLNDMYRFGIQSPEWIGTSDAINSPGTLLPIPSAELNANPLIN